MTRVELNKEFRNFSSEMNIILEKLNEQYFLITEKYGSSDAELLLEGFWDTLKKGAESINKASASVGKTLSKGVENIKGAAKSVAGGASWLWNKGVQLGQDALDKINKLSQTIWQYIKDCGQWIVSAPGKFFTMMQNMWIELKNNLDVLKQSAKDKFQEIVTTICDNISKKIIEPLKAKWKEFEKNYANAKAELEKKAADLKKMADDFVKSGKEDLVAVGNAILKGVETAGFFIVGLVMLPFYLVFKGTEYLYTVGANIVKNIKQNATEVWGTLQPKKSFGEGWEEGKIKESKILNFEGFMKKL